MTASTTWTRQLTLAQLARQEYLEWQRLRQQDLVPAAPSPERELAPTRDCGVAAVQAGLLAD